MLGSLAQKFNYTFVYIFHTIYPEKSIWRTILLQTNIFNIFPAIVSLGSVRNILGGVCIRKTTKYIPQSALGISRLFIELANRDNRICLTLDCSGINKKQKQINLVFKLVILILLMTNICIMTLLASEKMRLNRTIEFSLRLFTIRVRRKENRTLMLQKKLAT